MYILYTQQNTSLLNGMRKNTGGEILPLIHELSENCKCLNPHITL